MPRMRTLTVVTTSVFGKSTISIGAVALVVLLHALPVPIWPALRRSTNGVVTLGHFGLHAANVAAATLLKSPEKISFSYCIEPARYHIFFYVVCMSLYTV